MEQRLRSAGIDPGESVMNNQLIEDDDESGSDSDDIDGSNLLSSDCSSASPEDRRSFDTCTSPQSAASFSVESPSKALFLKTDQGRQGIFFGRKIPVIRVVFNAISESDSAKDLRRVSTFFLKKESISFARNQASTIFLTAL